ncbi:ion transporter [Sphingomonas sp.]|uniref:ion transporter n=1 Tax=Sphingomonas sp. TaxID=28214 RepID=UPI002DB5E252|nr:ion transporter [Sphingomonas sp.]HEU4967315.1 ion transporter [Sphingomonas sp.]
MAETLVAPNAVERAGVLAQLEDWLRTPMLVLSFVWLALVLVELVWGESEPLEIVGTAIWIAFLIEFAVRFSLAPAKLHFLKSNWLSVLALAAPAFRLIAALRFLRFARAARGLRLVRIVGTANRGMNALRASLGRRRFGYVLALTLVVVMLGAGGMLAFEPAEAVEGGFTSYADALWWTAILLTSIGSQYWPQTDEGRLLCFLLSLYGFAVFGYITASFASFFVGRDAAARDGEVAGTEEIRALKEEIVQLRIELRGALGARL